MIRLENYRREVQTGVLHELLYSNFVPDEYDFPEGLKDRISESEFEFIKKKLNDIVLCPHDIETRLIFQKLNRNCLGLFMALTGIVIVLLSLISIGINHKKTSIILLYTFISIGFVVSVMGLVVIAIPKKHKKWKKNAMIWASKMNEIYGEKGLVFKIDIREEGNDVVQINNALVIEIKDIPNQIYEFEAGQMVLTIPSFIPPKAMNQVSIP